MSEADSFVKKDTEGIPEQVSGIYEAYRETP